MLKTQKFTFGDLEALLKNPEWVFIEINPLDDWTGLISFDSAVEEVCLISPSKDKTKIKLILNKLTKRFLRSCPYAKNQNELRHAPAFVTLPSSDCDIYIVGMVFKLNNNGTTFICMPKPYDNLWLCWFKLLKEEIQQVFVERFKIIK